MAIKCSELCRYDISKSAANGNGQKTHPVPFSESGLLPAFRVVGLLSRESRRPEKLIVEVGGWGRTGQVQSTTNKNKVLAGMARCVGRPLRTTPNTKARRQSLRPYIRWRERGGPFADARKRRSDPSALRRLHLITNAAMGIAVDRSYGWLYKSAHYY